VARYYFLSNGCCLKVAVLSLWGALSDERSGLSLSFSACSNLSIFKSSIYVSCVLQFSNLYTLYKKLFSVLAHYNTLCSTSYYKQNLKTTILTTMLRTIIIKYSNNNTITEGVKQIFAMSMKKLYCDFINFSQRYDTQMLLFSPYNSGQQRQ
jgi:hypothetical protein